MPSATIENTTTTVWQGAIALISTYDRWSGHETTKANQGSRWPTTENLVGVLRGTDSVFLTTWALEQPRLVSDFEAARDAHELDFGRGPYAGFVQWLEGYLAHPLATDLVADVPAPAEVARLDMRSPLEMVVLIPGGLLTARLLGLLIDVYERVHTVRLRIELENEELMREIDEARLARGELEQRRMAQAAASIRRGGGRATDAYIAGQSQPSSHDKR